MPFDSASMDLEKAMGRVTEQHHQHGGAVSHAFTLQCVTGGLERSHCKRLIQFLRKHAIVELSLFRTDVGTHPEATTMFCRYLASAPLHTLRLRSVMLNAAQTRQVLNALAEHGRLEEFVYDGAALNQATDALVGFLEHNTVLRKLDLSCEMWALGSTEPLARGLMASRNTNLHHLSLNGCQLEDADAAHLLEWLGGNECHPTLSTLELRYNQLRERSLASLAKLLIQMPTPVNKDSNRLGQSQQSQEGRRAVIPPRSTNLHLLDLSRNVTLFAGDVTENIDLFCQALGDNTNLKSLYVRHCGVSAYALEQIAAAVVRNTTLKVLDVRQLGLPAQARFPVAFMDRMAEWQGVETLELDFKFTAADADAFVQALRRNTSLLSGSLEGLPTSVRADVEYTFRRNRWWKRARDLLADNHPALYASHGGVWMHALARMKQQTDAGDTAVFCTLRERLSLWLESKEMRS